MRAAAPLIAACLISSCARPDYADPRPDFFILSAGPQPEYAIKRVVEKQKPATLVGDDGSVCRTSVERFSGTAVGRWIACDWALPNLDSTDLARAGGLTAVRRAPRPKQSLRSPAGSPRGPSGPLAMTGAPPACRHPF